MHSDVDLAAFSSAVNYSAWRWRSGINGATEQFRRRASVKLCTNQLLMCFERRIRSLCSSLSPSKPWEPLYEAAVCVPLSATAHFTLDTVNLEWWWVNNGSVSAAVPDPCPRPDVMPSVRFNSNNSLCQLVSPVCVCVQTGCTWS